MAKDFDYQTYLASREWALKRERVRERSGNQCERCFSAPQQAVHHLTYANIGDEPLKDLLAICNPCHEYLSGKSSDDPRIEINQWAVITPAFSEIDFGTRHLIFPFDEPPHRPDKDPVSFSVRCEEETCWFCEHIDNAWPLFAQGLVRRMTRYPGSSVRGLPI